MFIARSNQFQGISDYFPIKSKLPDNIGVVNGVQNFRGTCNFEALGSYVTHELDSQERNEWMNIRRRILCGDPRNLWMGNAH